MTPDITFLSERGRIRFDILQQAPLDQWIALSHDESKMVAASTDLDDAVALSEAAGEYDPIMIKTPPFWGEFVGDWPTYR